MKQQYLQNYQQSQIKQPLRDELHLKIEQSNQQLLRYDEQIKLQQQLHTITKKKQQEEQTLKQQKQTILQISKTITDNQEQLTRYRDTETTVLSLQHQQQLLSQKEKELEQLQQKKQTYQKLHIAFDKLQKQYLKQLSDYNYQQTQLQLLETTYFHQQGILASSLQENTPCPVCGSTHHPNKATLVKNAPTEQQLKQLKEQLQFQQEAVSKQSIATGEQKGKVETAYQALVEQAQQLLNISDLSCLDPLLLEQFSQLAKKQSEVSQQIKEFNQQFQLKQQLELQLPKLQKQFETLQFDIQDKEKQLVTLEMEEKNAQTMYLQLTQELPYSTKQEAIAHVQKLKQQKLQLEQELSQTQKVYETFEKECASQQTKKELLEKQIQESPVLNYEELQMKKQHFQLEKQKILEQKDQIYLRYSTNVSIFQSLSLQSEKILQVEKKWNMVQAINNTVNGKVAGKDKIMLETYIQMTYFDRIIARANTRFMAMSNGQYELKEKQMREIVKAKVV